MAPLDISLYIHVPFCKVKCPYCHFYVIPYEEVRERRYVEAIEKEWQRVRELFEGKQLVSIYFGGGTPSLLSPESLKRLLQLFPREKSCEITLEANPESVTLEKMRALRSLGINRLSIGVQSLDDDQLVLLDRRHRATKAIDAIEKSREAGFENISIDLMYDIPGQTLASWERTVDRAVTLPITHLSLYNLTIEPQTLFFKKQRELTPMLPAPEESLAMLEYAVTQCESARLKRYEISAFARDGLHSRHNTGYWTARPFLGLGPSAFSYFHGKRFKNVSSFSAWCTAIEDNRSPVDFVEKLLPDAAYCELLAVQLRLFEGVDMENFSSRHGAMPAILHKTLSKLVSEGLLSRSGSHLSLTSRGHLFYDAVAEAII